MYNKKIKSFIAFLLMIGVISAFYGCATSDPKVIAYQTLRINANIYEAGYPAFVDLWKQGLISDETMNKGEEFATKYWAAYHMAQKALAAWYDVDNVASEQKVNEAIKQLQMAFDDLEQYIEPFIEKGGEEQNATNSTGGSK